MLALRPFARHDRDGLTRLANAHIAAALPGGAIPTSTLLSQLEQDSDEYIVDPWVVDRHTLVAIEADRVVAAAHLRRYGTAEPVGPDYQDAAEIAWLLCWPDHLLGGRAVLDAAIEHLRSWRSRIWYADGNLPCPGVYGIAESWPHIAALLADGGFAPNRAEVLFAGELDAIAGPDGAPVEGMELTRRVGNLGTRFDADLHGELIGSFEVDASLSRGGALRAMEGWADVANHWVSDAHRGRGIGSWLLREGCAWLRLGGAQRLLAYADHDDAVAASHFYRRFGLGVIGRSQRGWSRDPS